MSVASPQIDCGQEITAMAFSDAEHIVTAGKDGIIRRWRTRDGKQVQPEIRARGNVLCLSASEHWIVAGTEKGAIVWNAKTHEESTVVQEGVPVLAVDISPDSHTIATASDTKLVVVSDTNGDCQHLSPVWSANVEGIERLGELGLRISQAWLWNLQRLYLVMTLVAALLIVATDPSPPWSLALFPWLILGWTSPEDQHLEMTLTAILARIWTGLRPPTLFSSSIVRLFVIHVTTLVLSLGLSHVWGLDQAVGDIVAGLVLGLMAAIFGMIYGGWDVEYLHPNVILMGINMGLMVVSKVQDCLAAGLGVGLVVAWCVCRVKGLGMGLKMGGSLAWILVVTSLMTAVVLDLAKSLVTAVVDTADSLVTSAMRDIANSLLGRPPVLGILQLIGVTLGAILAMASVLILVMAIITIPLFLPMMSYSPRLGYNLGGLSIKISPDNKSVAVGYLKVASKEGGMICVFRTIDGEEIGRIKTLSSSFAWMCDCQQLLIASTNEVTFFDVLSEESRQSTWKSFAPLSIITVLRSGIVVSCTSDTVSFRHTATGSEICPEIQAQRICLSPDGLSLACTGADNRITIQSLRQLLPSVYLFGCGPLAQENSVHGFSDAQSTLVKAGSGQQNEQRVCPQFESRSSILASQLHLPCLSDTLFVQWSRGDLDRARGILDEEIENFRHVHHTVVHQSLRHAFANRAFILARQRDWRGAEEDAEKSLECQPSVIGLISKSIALVGLGRYAEAFAICDRALMQCDANESRHLFLIKYIIFGMAKKYDDAIVHITHLMDSESVDDTSIYSFVQAQMYLQLGDWHVERDEYECAIQSFARARVPPIFPITAELCMISLISGWSFEGLKKTIRGRLHDTLTLALRRTMSIEGSRFCPAITLPGGLLPNAETMLHEHLKRVGDEAINSNKQEEAISYYALAFSLNWSDHVFADWVSAMLTRNSWEDTFNIAVELKVPEPWIYWEICRALGKNDRLYEATECFCKMAREMPLTMSWCEEFKKWLSDQLQKLVHDASAWKHCDAIRLYSSALLLDPSSKSLLAGRSKVLARAGKWDAALRDADKIVDLYPSSHLGYERRHAALLVAKNYNDSLEAYGIMYGKLSQSPDRDTDPSSQLYISPSKIDETIRGVVESTIRNSPSVLINTITGRLRDKSQQTSEFATTAVYKELRASMTTGVDHARLQEAVKKFYAYAMLSHTWEPGADPEPTFQLLERTTVYELQKTLTNDKLQEFCLLARALGYIWAWSDTCCIDQLNQVVLQESLVSMFRWYHGSTVTFVFLREAAEDLESLDASYWNTRVWTYQEYVAAEAIRFYTKGWKAYRGLLMTNHKEDETIRKELEPNMATRSKRALQPGLENIREKLRLASTRNATREEDAAYSLFGIFNISMPVIYGEGGSAALGRLLAHLLTASGDASILAWTGKSGSFNSCFPSDISVFHELATTHLPVQFDENQMHSIIIIESYPSSLDQELTALYSKLNNLTVPSFAANRMRLPCVMFGALVLMQTDMPYVYCADTPLFGKVEIRTKEDLLRLDRLHLIHPWLNSLLEEPLDSITQGPRLVARLKEKFGALLLTRTDIGYRRVASDALIRVQVKADLPLKDLIDGLDIRTVDIL